MCQSNFSLIKDAEIGGREEREGRRYTPFHWAKGEAIPSVLKEERTQTTQRLPSTEQEESLCWVLSCVATLTSVSLLPSVIGLDLLIFLCYQGLENTACKRGGKWGLLRQVGQLLSWKERAGPHQSACYQKSYELTWQKITWTWNMPLPNASLTGSCFIEVSGP